MAEVSVQAKGMVDFLTAEAQSVTFPLENIRRWFLGLVVAAIVLSGPMLLGYAVFDEIAIYAILLVVLTKGVPRVTRVPELLEKIHYLLFLAFVVYFFVQTIRGVFALADVRVVRFTVMFLAIGVLAHMIYRCGGRLDDAGRVARTVVLASVAYFLAYVVAGVVAEGLAGV